MRLDIIIDNLTKELSPSQRLKQLVRYIQQNFHCSAVGLLRLYNDTLFMVAAEGLSHDTLGRQFQLVEHPRLASIVHTSGLVHFDSHSPLPDPYDGLVNTTPGQPLHVHDCLGIRLHINEQLWGVLTLDALENSFTPIRKQALVKSLPLFEACIRVAELEHQLKEKHHFSTIEIPSNIKNQRKIIGNSPAVLALLDDIRLVAEADLPVLITGETGVGKDLVAHYVHAYSKRHAQPMVIINCAALPETLAESELFGHIKGAFSGATHERAGRFEVANNGTLFLDEIGELSLPVQSKLLRAIQNGEIQRLGSDKTHHVNVRIIAASNRDLQKAAEEGTFRMDLYHRLSVFPIEVPALRERGKDILLLAGHFLEQNRVRLGLRGIRLSPEANQLLLQYRWPGNVRELEHIISRAALKIIASGINRNEITTLEAKYLDIHPSRNIEDQNISSSLLDSDILSPTIDSPHTPVNENIQYTTLPQATKLGALKPIIQQVEYELIKATLEHTNYHWTAAAKILDIDASNLHKLAKKLGLKSSSPHKE